MTRAYIRLDPGFFERKAIDQEYPPRVLAALVGAICLAEHQPERGRFRNERVLKALLAEYGRHVNDLLERGDLVRLKDGRLYVDGWDEWQEGDVTVRDRMARLRARRRDAGHRNSGDGGDRHTPSRPATSVSSTPVERDGTAGQSGTFPPPPAERGRRKDGTNPRARGESPRDLGENPRANGNSIRQERERQKTGPVDIGRILRAAAAVGQDS